MTPLYMKSQRPSCLSDIFQLLVKTPVVTQSPSSSALGEGLLASVIVATIELISNTHRRCPGRHFALNSVCIIILFSATAQTDTYFVQIYITIASILSAFNISKPIDQHGREYEPDVEYTAGLVLCVTQSFCYSTLTFRILQPSREIRMFDST